MAGIASSCTRAHLLVFNGTQSEWQHGEPLLHLSTEMHVHKVEGRDRGAVMRHRSNSVLAPSSDALVTSSFLLLVVWPGVASLLLQGCSMVQ